MRDTFKVRLERLFAIILQPANKYGTRERWPLNRVAREAGFSRQYLSDLLAGSNTNPGFEIVCSIAQAFATLSVESGTPCTRSAILAFLDVEGGGPLPADPSELQATYRPRDDRVLALKRVADLDDPASVAQVLRLVDRIDAERDAKKRGIVNRLRRRNSPGTST